MEINEIELEEDQIERKIIERIRNQGTIEIAALVEQISTDGSKTDAIVKELMALQDKARIQLSEPRQTFIQYLVSPDSIWFLEMLLATVVSLALLSVSSGPLLYLRYFFGALLVFFLPGYSLFQLLFAGRASVDNYLKYGFSLVLSIAIVILVGLALGTSPLGFGTIPTLTSVSLVTFVFLVSGVKRKYDYYKLKLEF
jgi:uncharacterized membrane protein